MKLDILLIVAFVSLTLSYPANCQSSSWGNGLSLEEQDAVLSLDATIQEINAECLKKNICLVNCKECTKKIYYEIVETHSLYQKYVQNCEAPKQKQVLDIVNQEFNSLRAEIYGGSNLLIALTRNENNMMNNFRSTLNQVNSARSKMSGFIGKIKKLCTKEESRISPEEQLKTLFELSKISITGHSTLSNLL